MSKKKEYKLQSSQCSESFYNSTIGTEVLGHTDLFQNEDCHRRTVHSHLQIICGQTAVAFE